MFSNDEQVKYKASQGSECPYCGADNLSADYFEWDGFSAWRRVDCLNPDCLRKWLEVFNFSHIED